ncbi:hypothetical protein ykris0001_43200 [Yersinia kristensenii ATCC 33638]|nr:hypothetical protein ykris0001_43200 [Yersinia kristensenii ATCC 33638]
MITPIFPASHRILNNQAASNPLIILNNIRKAVYAPCLSFIFMQFDYYPGVIVNAQRQRLIKAS